jgi:carboxypeptidase Q
MKPRTLSFALCVLLALTAAGQEKVHLDVIHRIKAEAFENSKVMDHMFYLTDVHGPRLTNSPGFRAAADWSVKRLQEYGLTNVKLEKWGPFGRGWSYSKFAAHMIEPGYSAMIGFPLAWTPGTNGVITGDPIHAVLRTEADFGRFKGKLKDKIVLIDPPRETAMVMTPLGRRYTENELAELSIAPEPGRLPGPFGGRPQAAPGGPAGRPGAQAGGPQGQEAARRFASRRNEFLKQEGALAVLTAGQRGDGGTLFAAAGGSRDAKDPEPPPMAAITPEHYNRVVRLLEKNIPVKLDLEIRARYHDENLDSFNIIGEIAGGRKKDELVMLGAHFDSWHGGTGATDNAAGSAVMMEAVRILKTLNLNLDRTVRLALWGGEEQGLLGSRAYVKEHFADPEKMVPTTEHSKLSGYFNYDNGTGKIRGVYLQGNDMVRPIFEAWLAPFKDLGATTLSIRNTGGTDHLSYEAVGLPGFQFIQDPAEYSTRTHHSNMDVYDHIVPGDLMQASAITASFVYHTAVRDEMLPRKPLPKPRPARGAGGGGATPPVTGQP